MIENNFEISYVARMALREKQIQQNYRPIIAVHKWFARRPGTLFRGLLLSEFCDKPLEEAFCQSNQLDGLRVADPFMGGGTPIIEANRLGCDVVGFDINPMSYWVVRQEIEHLDLRAYREQAAKLVNGLSRELGDLYHTRCTACASNASVKYFLWIKQHNCPSCQKDFDLWPGYLFAKDSRHPANIVICHQCSALNEVKNLGNLGKCGTCSARLTLEGTANRNRTKCPHCEHESKYPDGKSPPRHRIFAIEYYCEQCRSEHQGRFFKSPDPADIEKVADAEARLERCRCRFVPDDLIPQGDETKRLLRWGYTAYRDLFNSRQLLGLEMSCRAIHAVKDERVRNALATNLSDLLRYQNMLCRYDTTALKSLDVFSIHGFPVSLIECESNMLGIPCGDGNVGSGGWSNVIAKYAKAKGYCDRPFETIGSGTRKRRIYTDEEWIGDHRDGRAERRVSINCGDSATADFAPDSLDAIFTDPPYFGNVQYAELMDFCYVWLRKLVGDRCAAFQTTSTRNNAELTGNATAKRGIEHFAEGLSRVLQTGARALKPGAPLAFTYHHNALSAYYAIGVAVLDSGLPCTIALHAQEKWVAPFTSTAPTLRLSIPFLCVVGTLPRPHCRPTCDQQFWTR